jgi:hypothetical protein
MYRVIVLNRLATRLLNYNLRSEVKFGWGDG